ncbi:CoA transferase [Polynucleobacter sp. JS-Mosq-20-D10]|uniref:CaiB/BaiF CoA transferase family protein n=1 Tax=Polynucleobacter sp. JS-Mosq-20-D10 TaxID=2576922 RepID=UPI001BFE61A0|nr:CoA transferase [Polynucleobacter sp. JS-Mosq-20-D10]QWE00961.1 CoA transferase [Polynucleobacter sp. JS-Mosq-20-D10]
MKPLSGIKVLDLTRIVSGPFATMLLGDLGAEIIKIEEPASGDESRTYGPPFIHGESAYFLSVNRNKKSCAVNLKTPEGIALIRDLALKSDVLIENFRPGTLKKFGLSYEELTKQNPGLIYCAITGFGQTGPDSHRPGYDLIIQGESGVMDITGDPDGPPTKVGTSIADLITGQYASQGVLAALVERSRTGVGRRVEVAMYDCLASLLTFNAGSYFSTGNLPKRKGNSHPSIVPYETFETLDGWINIGVANDKFWNSFCKVIDRLDLQHDPKFAIASDRVKNRLELLPIIREIIKKNKKSYWIELLEKAGIPSGMIKNVGEVCDSEQLVSRGMVLNMPHPTAGIVKNIDSPLRFDDRNDEVHIAPPILGQHTREILRDILKISPAEIMSLEKKGAIKCTDI